MNREYSEIRDGSEERLAECVAEVIFRLLAGGRAGFGALSEVADIRFGRLDIECEEYLEGHERHYITGIPLQYSLCFVGDVFVGQ